jgi:menaquinone-dependent protoporphyrinogen oxidase
VVLGIAVYIGGWRKEAVKFLKVNEGALTEKSLWLFSSGPTGEGDPVELLEGWQMPKGQQTLIERIQPKDIVVFHGNVDVDKVNRLHKWMIKNVKAPIGDFRDWDAIVAWAESIATELNGVE